jgi:hypothetical protein
MCPSLFRYVKQNTVEETRLWADETGEAEGVHLIPMLRTIRISNPRSRRVGSRGEVFAFVWPLRSDSMVSCPCAPRLSTRFRWYEGQIPFVTESPFFPVSGTIQLGAVVGMFTISTRFVCVPSRPFRKDCFFFRNRCAQGAPDYFVMLTCSGHARQSNVTTVKCCRHCFWGNNLSGDRRESQIFVMKPHIDSDHAYTSSTHCSR